jgi:hypothetical protein
MPSFHLALVLCIVVITLGVPGSMAGVISMGGMFVIRDIASDVCLFLREVKV